MSALLLGLVAAAAPSLTVEVAGKCPAAEAVSAALGSALGTDVRPRGPQAEDVPKVTDMGDRFSVSAFGQAREYADPARDCDERARAAAVFIALALNPPLAAAPPVKEPAVSVAAPPPAPAAPGQPTGWFDVGAAGRLDVGSQPEAPFAGGFEIHVAAGRRWLGVAATAGLLAPSDLRYASVTVRQQRFPLSLAVTARHRISPRLAIAGAFGAALVPLTLRANGVENGPSETRLDTGVRIAFELRILATRRLAPFVDLHAEIFPRAYELAVDPVGDVGSTGRFWLGASVGLSFEAP